MTLISVFSLSMFAVPDVIEFCRCIFVTFAKHQDWAAISDSKHMASLAVSRDNNLAGGISLTLEKMRRASVLSLVPWAA